MGLFKSREQKLLEAIRNNGDIEKIEALIKKGVNLSYNDYYLVSSAVVSFNYPVIESLMNAGVPADIHDGGLLNTAVRCAYNKDLDVCEQIIILLFARGCSVNSRGATGALYTAAEYGFESLVSIFLREGVDPKSSIHSLYRIGKVKAATFLDDMARKRGIDTGDFIAKNIQRDERMSRAEALSKTFNQIADDIRIHLFEADKYDWQDDLLQYYAGQLYAIAVQEDNVRAQTEILSRAEAYDPEKAKVCVGAGLMAGFGIEISHEPDVKIVNAMQDKLKGFETKRLAESTVASMLADKKGPAGP